MFSIYYIGINNNILCKGIIMVLGSKTAGVSELSRGSFLLFILHDLELMQTFLAVIFNLKADQEKLVCNVYLWAWL